MRACSTPGRQRSTRLHRRPLPRSAACRDADHTGLPAEYARGLLAQMHNDPSHNATWDLFWSTQPAPDAVLAPELWTEELIAMLQCPELVGRGGRSWSVGAAAGAAPVCLQMRCCRAGCRAVVRRPSLAAALDPHSTRTRCCAPPTLALSLCRPVAAGDDGAQPAGRG